MTAWIQLAWPQPCGYCGVPLAAGVRVLEVTFPQVRRKRIRCQVCAQGFTQPTTDVPRQMTQSVATPDMVGRMAHIGQVAVQFRRQEPLPKPKLVPKKTAYRGEDPAGQGHAHRAKDDLLTHLPRTWRG
jgi:hypothetical protein